MRRRFFWVFDTLLVLAVAYVWAHYFAHRSERWAKLLVFGVTPESTAFDAMRVALTFLRFERIGVRALPYALNVIERFDFRSMVAARHLRAK